MKEICLHISVVIVCWASFSCILGAFFGLGMYLISVIGGEVYLWGGLREHLRDNILFVAIVAGIVAILYLFELGDTLILCHIQMK